MTPVKRSTFSESFRRRISFTLASVPAFSSAFRVLDLALAEQTALGVDLLGGQGVALERRLARTAAGPVKNVMWAILNGVSGTVPLGCPYAGLTSGTAARGTPAAAAAPAAAVPTVTPRRARKSRRLTS